MWLVSALMQTTERGHRHPACRVRTTKWLMTQQAKPDKAVDSGPLAELGSMIAAGADPPPLSWEILHAMMDAPNGRSEAWRQAGHWALDVLEAELGTGWPEIVRAKNPTGGAPLLARAAGYAVAYAEILELALRLRLLRKVNGRAKLWRTLRKDPRPEQLLHCGLQLEVASLALRSAAIPELEPPPREDKPADVAVTIGGRRILIETRGLLTSAEWRRQNDWTDRTFEQIRHIEFSHAVRCEGEITVLLDEQQTERLLTSIETHARLLAARIEPPPIRIAGVAVNVVPQSQQPAKSLKGPRTGGDSWARLEAGIRDKVEVAMESGANWLRLDDRDGLWQFTGWSTKSLPDKLLMLDGPVRPMLGKLDGIVLSCGALLAQGTFADEDVQLAPDLVALRRRLPFMRVRETLILANHADALPALEAFDAYYADEPLWLDWALDRVSLPTTAAILAC